MVDSTIKTKRSKSLAREAKWWLRHGVRPIVIRKRSKKPIGDDWNQVRNTADSIDRVFKPGLNLGGLWGKCSKWIVDVDLDWDEVCLCAAAILPETYAYGREDRPGSHLLYTVPDSKTTKWIDPETKEVIIELRSTGSQSVLPGSTHPDGDLYISETDGDPVFTQMSYGKMCRLLGRLAAVGLCARYYPSKGGRHDFIHAFTGTLLHSGAKPKEARSLALALLDAVGSKETDRAQRERTIDNTIESHTSGTTHGWKTLAEYLPESIMKRLKTWIRFSDTSVEIVSESELEKPKPQKIAKMTSSQSKRPTLDVPGLVGDIARWTSRRAEVVQPLFDLAVGLWCTALLSGNRYKVGMGFNTPLQPYFMLLAPTGAGKDNTHGAAFEIARKTGFRDNVFTGFQSYHVLADKIAAAPSMCGWLWDEAARKLKSATNPGSQDYQVLTWLIKLYGKGSSSTPGLPARNEASSVGAIDFPFFLVMATSQPGPFIDAISNSTSSFDTGLINRFVLFDAGEMAIHYNDQKQTTSTLPSTIVRAAEKFKERPLPLEDRPQTPITMSNATYAKFRTFRNECGVKMVGGSPTDTLWARANQNALILAGIVAVGCYPGDKHVVIDEATADWAISFIRWSLETWSERLEGSVARNFVEVQSKTLEKYIRDAKKYLPRAKRGNWKALLAQGYMPKAFLTTLSRHIRGNELKTSLETLVEAGIVEIGETDSGMEFYKWKGDK